MKIKHEDKKKKAGWSNDYLVAIVLFCETKIIFSINS